MVQIAMRHLIILKNFLNQTRHDCPPFRDKCFLEHPLHLDWYNSPDNLLTSILYYNTNNGYTRCEDGTKIDSVANRLITFSNNIKHGGAVNTCDAIHRCVMNINWIKKVV